MQAVTRTAATRHRWVDPRGSMTGALMFAILVTALLAGAALAAMQVSRSRSAVEYSGVALLAVGDRLQDALHEINTGDRALDPKDRIRSGPQHRVCDAVGVCTEVTVSDGPGGSVAVQVEATVPDGARAVRQALLVPLATSGAVTGVDEAGRPRFAPDGGSGVDLWQLVAGGDL